MVKKTRHIDRNGELHRGIIPGLKQMSTFWIARDVAFEGKRAISLALPSHQRGDAYRRPTLHGKSWVLFHILFDFFESCLTTYMAYLTHQKA